MVPSETVDAQRSLDDTIHDFAARRLHALHALAFAAIDSTTLDELAPHYLKLVCELFGWRGAALAHWPGDDAEAGPEVRDTYGSASCAIGVPPPSDDSIAVVAGADGSPEWVVVPVGQPAHRYAWLYCLDGADLDAEQNELLSIISIASSRVLERDLAARKNRDSERRFRLVFDASPLPMGLTYGYDGLYTEVNDALCVMLGRTREELIGTSAREICHPDDRAKTDPAGAAALASPDGRHRVELRLVHAAGFILTTMVTLAWLTATDGKPQLLAQVEDITARRAAEEVLRDRAEQDGLTGLANREQLLRVLTERAAAAVQCAVLFIDLDGFKVVNDTRGHSVGDEVLVAVAGRLRDAVRPSDLVARFGGDEFVIVCRKRGESDGESLAQRVADRVEAALKNPIVTSAGMVRVTASVGIAEGPLDRTNPQSLLQHADTAMYQAKRLGKDRHAYYDVSLHKRTVELHNTEQALRTALDDRRFIVHYQPIVKLSDATIIGFEALVRLVDERGELVPPSKFIAVAEQSGLIVPMGKWVLQESCRVLAQLRQQTGTPLTMSVNVAPRQVARADLADTVMGALSDAGLPRSAVALELTESALLEANESTLRQLTNLRDLGVFIALDDFGTGYSSMTYLRNFPISHLKVDRSFVSGMVNVTSDRAIVHAVTRLARDLGMYWVAEGVETVAQRNALASLGNGLAQGYLFSRPVPANQLPALLAAKPPAGGEVVYLPNDRSA